MNRILLGIFTVALCFAVGHTLQCYKCDLGIGNLCITSKVTCNSGEQCFSGEGKAAGIISLKMKGCLIIGQCNQTDDVEFPSGVNKTIYKMTKTCCDTDLCNSATRLPVLHTLPLLLCSLATVFVAKVVM